MGEKTDKTMDRLDALDKSDTAAMPTGPVDRTNLWPPLLAGLFFLVLFVVGIADGNTGLAVTTGIMLVVAAVGTVLNGQRSKRRRQGIGPGPRS